MFRFKVLPKAYVDIKNVSIKSKYSFIKIHVSYNNHYFIENVDDKFRKVLNCEKIYIEDDELILKDNNNKDHKCQVYISPNYFFLKYLFLLTFTVTYIIIYEFN